MECGGYPVVNYNNFNSQLPTPPGSDSAYSPEQAGYYSPQDQIDGLIYQQCMAESTPQSATVHHQVSPQNIHHQVSPNTTVSPINHHQVSPHHHHQISPGTATNMTSNIAPPTQSLSSQVLMLQRMQQEEFVKLAHCSEVERLEMESRRLSHMGAVGNYPQGLPIDLYRITKKRKMASPTTMSTQNIKPDPGKGPREQEDITSTFDECPQFTSCPETGEETTNESYRSLPWADYQKEKWAPMMDANCRPIADYKYVVSADKGFVHSDAHSAFVSQKKNHFQVTVSAVGFNGPKYIRTDGGYVEIRGFYVSLYGFKNESKNQLISINQSTVERQKYSLEPIRVEFHNGSLTKTIPRLHFSATTENNMRKKGKPNPNQRFFSLVVMLEAETPSNQRHLVAACISERIIVRASSPSNFDLEQQLWERVDANSIRYMGNVAVNMERTDQALAVGGNIVVTGNIRQFSDERIKENIVKADTMDELKKIQELNLYNFDYSEEFCDYSNINPNERAQFGVIAQEVQKLLPDAVKTIGDVNLSTGKIENVLTVNKDRIYMAGVGAVKELSGITDNIIEKIDELEEVNTTLMDRFKRRFGSKTTLNSSIRGSKRWHGENGSFTSSSESLGKKDIRKSLRLMQGIICFLSLVVVICLGAIVSLFFVMHKNAAVVAAHHNEQTLPPHNVTDAPPVHLTTKAKHPFTKKDHSRVTQRQNTVTQEVTYGPTKSPPMSGGFLQYVECSALTELLGLKTKQYDLSHMSHNVAEKRLDCRYNLHLSVEEYFLATNQRSFNFDIRSTHNIITEECQSHDVPCKDGNVVIPNNTTRQHYPPSSPGYKHSFDMQIVSGMNKIVTKIRVLPKIASCVECCKMSEGLYLDVHYTFEFKCPKNLNGAFLAEDQNS